MSYCPRSYFISLVSTTLFPASLHLHLIPSLVQLVFKLTLHRLFSSLCHPVFAQPHVLMSSWFVLCLCVLFFYFPLLSSWQFLSPAISSSADYHLLYDASVYLPLCLHRGCFYKLTAESDRWVSARGFPQHDWDICGVLINNQLIQVTQTSPKTKYWRIKLFLFSVRNIKRRS